MRAGSAPRFRWPGCRRCSNVGADREPRRAEPVPHRTDRRVGRGVPRAHLRRAQVVTVGAAVRIGHGRGDGFGPGLVTHLEEDAEPDTAVGCGCRDLVAWRCPIGWSFGSEVAPACAADELS